jgi:hypothetical protein
MAGTLSTIRTGLGNRLRTINGLRVAEHLPEQINAPLAVVQLERVEYHRAFAGGASEWQFVIVAVVGRMGERTAQQLLDDLMAWTGPRSLRAAIEADRSLGGAAQTSQVVAARGVRPFNVGDAAYLGVEFEVTVIA